MLEVLVLFNETSDHQRLAQLGTELAHCQSELDEVEEKWLNTIEAIENYNH